MTPLSTQLEELARAGTQGKIAVNPFSAYIDCTQLDEHGDPTPIAALAWPTTYRSEDETRANGNLIAVMWNNLPTIIQALKDKGL